MTKDRLRKIMGTNIRNERISRNLSIDELAELIGRTPGFMGLIERGRRGATALTLYKLSEALDMSMDQLFRESPEDLALAKMAEDNPEAAKRTKLSAIVCGLNEHELDFVISAVKSLKTMSNAINGSMSDSDDEDEEEDTIDDPE